MIAADGGDINVMALVKGVERYVWLWRDTEKTEVIRRIGRAASNPDLSITWSDAAHLAARIRESRRSSGERR